jgi:hypothetical protein
LDSIHCLKRPIKFPLNSADVGAELLQEAASSTLSNARNAAGASADVFNSGIQDLRQQLTVGRVTDVNRLNIPSASPEFSGKVNMCAQGQWHAFAEQTDSLPACETLRFINEDRRALWNAAALSFGDVYVAGMRMPRPNRQ